LPQIKTRRQRGIHQDKRRFGRGWRMVNGIKDKIAEYILIYNGVY
jgi:hypothetical protein